MTRKFIKRTAVILPRTAGHPYRCNSKSRGNIVPPRDETDTYRLPGYNREKRRKKQNNVIISFTTMVSIVLIIYRKKTPQTFNGRAPLFSLFFHIKDIISRYKSVFSNYRPRAVGSLRDDDRV